MDQIHSFGPHATLAVWLVLSGLAASGLVRRDPAVPEEFLTEKVTVSLCDGESTFTVSGLKAGEALAPPEARRIAREMMAVWRQTAGEERSRAWQVEEAAAKPALAPEAAQESAQATKFTAQDLLLWKQEEEKWIADGYKNFHTGTALGGTIGISCDMCHPDAANTHPETYPKFQMQSKKVSLLRDMINWCIENPMKGKPLPENDPRLRSVEAYILSTRRGVPLEPGKH